MKQSPDGFERKFFFPFFSGIFLTAFFLTVLKAYSIRFMGCELPLAFALAAALFCAVPGVFLEGRIQRKSRRALFACISIFLMLVSGMCAVLFIGTGVPLFPIGGVSGELLTAACVGGFAFGGFSGFLFRSSFRNRAGVSGTAFIFGMIFSGLFFRFFGEFFNYAFFRIMPFYFSGLVLLVALVFPGGKRNCAKAFLKGAFLLLFFGGLPLGTGGWCVSREILQVKQFVRVRPSGRENFQAALSLLQTSVSPVEMILFSPGGHPGAASFLMYPNLKKIILALPGKMGNLPAFIMRSEKVTFRPGARPTDGNLPKTDLIFLAPERADSLENFRLFLPEQIRKIKSNLRPGGVLALLFRIPQNASVRDTEDFLSFPVSVLRNEFAFVGKAPGNENLFFASDSILPSDPVLLDRRALERFGPNLLPPGVMDILFPLLKKEMSVFPGKKTAGEPEPSSGFRTLFRFWKNGNELFDNGPGFLLKKTIFPCWKILLYSGFVLLFFYICIRYFLSARMAGKMHFTTFENAFCMVGILLETAFFISLRNDAFFDGLPLLCAWFAAGGGFAFFIRKENAGRVSRIASGISLILPWSVFALGVFMPDGKLFGVLMAFAVCYSGFYCILMQRLFRWNAPGVQTFALPFSLGLVFGFVFLFPFPAFTGGIWILCALLTAARLGRLRK